MSEFLPLSLFFLGLKTYFFFYSNASSNPCESYSLSISSSYLLYSSRTLTKKFTLPSSVSVSIGSALPLIICSYFSILSIYTYTCSFNRSSLSSYFSKIPISCLFPFSSSSTSLFHLVRTSFNNQFLVSIWFELISFWISFCSLSRIKS